MTILRKNDRFRHPSRINITLDQHFIYDELEQPMAQRQVPMHHFLRDEAQRVFQSWDT